MATLIAANYQSTTVTSYGGMSMSVGKLKPNTLYTLKCRYKYTKNTSSYPQILCYNSNWTAGADIYDATDNGVMKTRIKTFTSYSSEIEYYIGCYAWSYDDQNNGGGKTGVLEVDWYELWEGDAREFSLKDAIALSENKSATDFLSIQNSCTNAGYFSTSEAKTAMRSWMGYYYKTGTKLQSASLSTTSVGAGTNTITVNYNIKDEWSNSKKTGLSGVKPTVTSTLGTVGTIGATDASGNGTVTLTVGSRGATIGNALSGTVTVAYGGVTKTLTFSQAGNYVTSISASGATLSYSNIGAGATSAAATTANGTVTYTFSSGSTSTTAPASTYGSLSIANSYTLSASQNGFTAVNSSTGALTATSLGTTISNARTSGTVTRTVTYTWTPTSSYNTAGTKTTTATKTATCTQNGNYITKIEANSNSFSYSNIGAGATSAAATTSHTPKYTFSSGSTSTTTPTSTYGSLSTSVSYSIANTTTNGFTAVNSSTGALTATNRTTNVGEARASATVTKTLKYTWTHTGTYGSSSVNTGNLTKTATCTQNANYITSVTLSVSAGAITHSAGTVGAGGGTVSVTSSTNGSYSGTLKYSSNSEKAASATEGTWSATYAWTESDANNMLSFTSANSSGMTVTVGTRGTTVGEARSSTITRKYSVTYTLKSGYNNIVTSKSDNKSTSALTISQAANAANASSKITTYGQPGAVTIGSGITAGGGSATLSATAPTNVRTYYYTSGSPGSTENVTGTVTYSVSSQYFATSSSATSGTTITRYSISNAKLSHSTMDKNVGYDFVTVKAANAGDSSKYTTASTKVQNSVGSYYVTAYGQPGAVTIGSGITAGGGSATLSASAPTNNTRRDYTSGSYDTSTATGTVTYSVSSQYFATSSSATSGTTITRYSVSGTKLSHTSMTTNAGYDFVTVKAANAGDSSKYTTASTKVQNAITGTTYGTPKITAYTYATFAASGATKTPTVTYEQTKTNNWTSGSTSDAGKETSGGTLKFSMTASNGFTLGSTTTGSMTAANNTTTTSTRKPSTMPTVTVTLHSKTSAAYSCTACSQSGGSRYFRVKSVSATSTTLPDVYNGYQSIYVTMQTTISGSKPTTSNTWSDIKGSEVASYSSGNPALGMYIYVNATGSYNDTSYITPGTPSLLNASSGKYYPTSTSSGVTRPTMDQEAKWMVNFTWQDATTEYSTTNTICVQWQEMANYGYSGAGKNYVQVTRNAKQNSGIPIYLYGYNGAGTDLYYQFAGSCRVKYSDPYSSGPEHSVDFNETGNISADYGSSYGLTKQMSDYPFEIAMVAGEPIGLITVDIYGDISNTLSSSQYNGCDMHVEIVDTSSSSYGGNTVFTSSAQTISSNYNPLRYGQRTCSFQVSGWIPAYANLEIRLCFVFSNK